MGKQVLKHWAQTGKNKNNIEYPHRKQIVEFLSKRHCAPVAQWYNAIIVTLRSRVRIWPLTQKYKI